jgi:hypothetical protein
MNYQIIVTYKINDTLFQETCSSYAKLLYKTIKFVHLIYLVFVSRLIEWLLYDE